MEIPALPLTGVLILMNSLNLSGTQFSLVKDEKVTSGHFKGLFYVINIMWKDDLMDYFGHRNP